MGILIVLLLLFIEALLTSSDVKFVPRNDVAADGILAYYFMNPMLLVVIYFY